MSSAYADVPRRGAPMPSGPRIAGAVMPGTDESAPIWEGPIEREALTPARPLVWFLGATGGAGVSSLTRSLAYAGDCQRGWPGYIGDLPGADSPLVVLVFRTTMHGVERAHSLLLQHAAGGTPEGTHILGVVSVADSDRPLSKPVRNRQPSSSRWRARWPATAGTCRGSNLGGSCLLANFPSCLRPRRCRPTRKRRVTRRDTPSPR
ncbi:hypothetical protein ACQGFJ_32235 [Rhodococcus sp. 3.70]